MTEPTATAESTADPSVIQPKGTVSRLTGFALVTCYVIAPIAGLLDWTFVVLAAVVVSQGIDLLVVNNEYVRAGFARAQLGIATRTLVREFAVIMLVLTDAWPHRADSVVEAICLLMVAGLRVLYHLLMVPIRARSTPPVETLNIDLSGIKLAPLVPDVMKRRLSERFHGLSSFALIMATIGVAAHSRPVLFTGVGVVLAAEVVADGVATRWLVRSRGVLGRAKLHATVLRRVQALQPEVMLYHSGSLDSAYQVNMWLSTVDRLERSALVVLRERDSLEHLAPTTTPVVYIPGPVEFMTFTLPTVRVAMYTANVGKVIHMLREPGVRHVFVGHGDSDKTASFNPFSKVYSEVWVAGEGGRERYRRAAIGIPDEDIIEVGRPQLAGIKVASAPLGDGDHDRAVTVLYAPTWEGWTGDPSHTSVIRTGVRLVKRLAALPGVRVVYKPHPFIGTVDPAAAVADAAIRAHADVVIGGAKPTLYECFNDSDVLVADISSVLSDFIASEKPYIVTNLTTLDEDEFRDIFPSANAAYLLDPDADRIGAILDLIRDSDPLAADRRSLKRYLLGPDDPDAMTRFAAAVEDAYRTAVTLWPTRIAAGAE